MYNNLFVRVFELLKFWKKRFWYKSKYIINSKYYNTEYIIEYQV
jgi:hypothetical protein